jgi:hypothetical protein
MRSDEITGALESLLTLVRALYESGVAPSQEDVAMVQELVAQIKLSLQ